MEDYKQDIESTRVGCLGGSDGNLLAQVANLGSVPKSAYKRLAVLKGLIEQDNVSTRVMRYGDFIEQSIFECLKENNDEYISNPLWISGKYSKDGVRLICHPDFVLYDEDKKVLKAFECKATKFNPQQTRSTYANQLFIEWTLANEVVKAKGEGWKVELYLCHYDTSNVCIEDDFMFDPSLLSIHRIRMNGNVFDIDRAMTILSEFLPTFEYFGEGDEIDSEYLPERVKQEFAVMTTFLREIKEREAKVEEFKARLTAFMKEKAIKSIRNEAWSITFVDETTSVSFDAKAYLADLASAHPRKANALKKKYEKRTKRAASVRIKINDNN